MLGRPSDPRLTREEAVQRGLTSGNSHAVTGVYCSRILAIAVSLTR
jgi:hypothetical protein